MSAHTNVLQSTRRIPTVHFVITKLPQLYKISATLDLSQPQMRNVLRQPSNFEITKLFQITKFHRSGLVAPFPMFSFYVWYTMALVALCYGGVSVSVQ